MFIYTYNLYTHVYTHTWASSTHIQMPTSEKAHRKYKENAIIHAQCVGCESQVNRLAMVMATAIIMLHIVLGPELLLPCRVSKRATTSNESGSDFRLGLFS